MLLFRGSLSRLPFLHFLQLYKERIMGMKIDRLLAITVLLLNRQRISAKELADRFEVSVKTIYRDIDALGQAGIPVVAHKGASGGFEIMEEYTISRLLLSIKEMAAILAAIKGAASALDDGLLEHLFEKMEALIGKKEQSPSSYVKAGVVFDFSPWEQSSAAREKVHTIKQAIERSLPMRISYSNRAGAGSERIIEPYKLILKGQLWYVQAFCTLKNEFRVFRLSRMTSYHILDFPFVPRKPPQLDKYAWDSEWSNENEQELLLTFYPIVRSRIEDTYPPGYIAILDDGSIQVKGRFIVDEWFYGNLLSYGGAVKVEEPADVALELKRRAQQIVEQYSNVDI